MNNPKNQQHTPEPLIIDGLTTYELIDGIGECVFEDGQYSNDSLKTVIKHLEVFEVYQKALVDDKWIVFAKEIIAIAQRIDEYGFTTLGDPNRGFIRYRLQAVLKQFPYKYETDFEGAHSEEFPNALSLFLKENQTND